VDEIAPQENRDIADLVQTMIEQYRPTTSKKVDWSLIVGISDADITDMSTSVRETLAEYYKKKYGDTD
jgi:hypothetical protein